MWRWNPGARNELRKCYDLLRAWKARLRLAHDFGHHRSVGDATEFEDAEDGVLDEIIRAGGAGRDSDDDGTIAGQFLRVARLLRFGVNIEMDDVGERLQAVRSA